MACRGRVFRRPCDRCEKMFLPTSKYQRICSKCNYSGDWRTKKKKVKERLKRLKKLRKERKKL